MARFKNVVWGIKPADADQRSAYNCEEANLAVLMDIRDELQALNKTLLCRNVTVGFKALHTIAMRDEREFKRRVEAAARKRASRRLVKPLVKRKGRT